MSMEAIIKKGLEDNLNHLEIMDKIDIEKYVKLIKESEFKAVANCDFNSIIKGDTIIVKRALYQTPIKVKGCSKRTYNPITKIWEEEVINRIMGKDNYLNVQLKFFQDEESIGYGTHDNAPQHIIDFSRDIKDLETGESYSIKE